MLVERLSIFYCIDVCMYGCVALSVRVHVQNVDPGCFVCMCIIIIIININLAFGPHLAVLPGKGLHRGGKRQKEKQRV